MKAMKHQSESGQILVLVLLVILVGVTIGLSIASRTISNLRNTAELDQSNRAFSAAEAGVERALSLLRTDPDACDSANNNCHAQIDGINARVEVVDVGGSSQAFGIDALDKDEAIQVNLDGYGGRYIDVYWGDLGDMSDCQNLAAALVVSVVYQQGSEYGMGKAALDKCNVAGRGATNGFETGSSISIDPTPPGGDLEIQDGTAMDDFGFRYRADLQQLAPAGSNPLLIRVRLMYNGPKQLAFAPVSATLPNQGQQIISTAEAGGLQRTVKVLKTNSALPAIFDYALFNGSTNSLTK